MTWSRPTRPALFDLVPMLTVLLDASGRILALNAAGSKLVGCEPSEVEGQDWFETFVPKGWHTAGRRLLAHALTGAPVQPFEQQLLTCAGGELWCRWSAELFGAPPDRAVLLFAEDLTEHRRAHNVLRMAEAVAQIGGWVYDVASQELRWTEEMRRIHEVPDDYVPDLATGLAFYDEDVMPVVAETVRAAMFEAAPWDLELPMRTARGRRVWVRTRGRAEWGPAEAPEVDPGPVLAPRLLVGSVQDITDRMEVQRSLASTQRTLEDIRRIQQLFITSDDPRPAFSELLEAFIRLTGSDHGFVGEIQTSESGPSGGWTLTHTAWTVPDIDADAARARLDRISVLLDQAVRSGHQVPWDVAVGPRLDVEGLRSFLAIPLVHGGHLVGLVGLANRPGGFDAAICEQVEPLVSTGAGLISARIAEHRRAEADAALTQSEERFRQLAIHSRDVFWLWEATTDRLLYVSPAYERLWGVPCEEIYTDPRAWRRAVHPDDLPALGVGSPAEGYDWEYRVVRPDGTIRWVHDRGFPIVNEAGEFVRLAAIAEDITARKLSEIERARLEEQLRQSQKMDAIGQLAGGVAHDFNNLLGGMIGELELVGALSMPGAVREALGSLRGLVDRAAGLTRQLLVFGRRQVIQRRTIDAGAAVTAMTRLLRRTLGENIDVRLRVPNEPAWIFADPGMFDQILMNLAVNARDAMPRGGSLQVEVTVEPAEDGAGTVRLTVTDTGPGIPAEVRDVLFEPFITTKPAGQGTGLGLATVFGIVTQHGGQVRAENVSPTGGARFIVTMPASGPPRAEALEPRPAPAEATGPARILLVEDEDAVRRVTRRMLEREGFIVSEATSAAAALTWWATTDVRPDLLLTDVVMPGELTGLELARLLRRDAPGLRVLVMSGFTVDLAGREAPDDDLCFVPKPFDRAELVAAIQRCLQASPRR